MKKRSELDTRVLTALDSSNEGGSLYVTLFVHREVPDSVTEAFHTDLLELTKTYFGKAEDK